MIQASEFIRDEVSARGWSTVDLRNAMLPGMPLLSVERLLRGEEHIDEAWAELLSKAFGTSCLLWLRLQQAADQEASDD